MKRFALIILVAVLAFSMITASAAVPKFMTQTYNNYAADYGFTVTFESSDEVVALLKEIQIPEEVNNFVDIKGLLESILSQGMQMKMQMNISDEYKKAEYALTAESQQSINVNSNLSIGIDSKLGMWMKMDLDAEDPMLEIIYSSPVLNKYMVIDVFEMLPDATQKAAVFNVLDSVFSSEYIDSLSEYSLELIEKYAEIKLDAGDYVVKLDNDGPIAMTGELFPVVFTKIGDIMANAPMAASIGVIGGADGPAAILIEPEAANDSDFAVIPDMTGLQILGEKGITYRYSLFSEKISAIDMAADISFDISKFVTEVLGEDWGFEEKGILDFAVKTKIKLKNIGKTKVEFPKITEENSFSIMDMVPEYEKDYTSENTPSYPHYSVWIESGELPVIDGEIYVPLRAALEGAFDDQVSIDYDKGTITMQSEYFPGFEKLTVYENSTMALADGIDRKVSKVIVKNDKAYVGKTFFEEFFGWELGYANYDLINDYYEAVFYTGLF